MLVAVRRKVARGPGALGFQKANPSTDPGVVVLFTRLGQLVDRAKVLVQERGEKHNAFRAGTDRRAQHRRRLRVGLLRLFSRAGQAVARTEPALEQKFRSIRPRITSLDFAASARSLIDAAREAGEKLAPEGITPALIDEAAALLAQYESAAVEAGESKNLRIKARAELSAVAAEIMGVLGRLDGLLRHRLADNPELLAAWDSARTGTGPIQSRTNGHEPAVQPPTGVTPPPDPAAGQARAA